MAGEDKASVPAKATERPLRRWDPFEMFTELQEEMARRWGQGWPWLPGPRLSGPSEMPGQWAPRTDVYEKDGNLVVKAELPGVKKEDIEVVLGDGDLVIHGERQAEQEVKEEHYYRMERSYGSFHRRIPLGFEVKPEQVEAKCSDGVLEISMPKPAETTPQAQKIKVV
jgi:HSP20 family protein